MARARTARAVPDDLSPLLRYRHVVNCRAPPVLRLLLPSLSRPASLPLLLFLSIRHLERTSTPVSSIPRTRLQTAAVCSHSIKASTEQAGKQRRAGGRQGREGGRGWRASDRAHAGNNQLPPPPACLAVSCLLRRHLYRLALLLVACWHSRCSCCHTGLGQVQQWECPKKKVQQWELVGSLDAWVQVPHGGAS